jgi:DedD protein
MARAAPTDEQVQLRRRARRRLIGAMALVTVIAVVLPWVLENEPRPSEGEIAIQIPSPDPGPFNARVAPGKDTGQRRATGADETAQTPADPARGADETMRAEQDKVLAAPDKPLAREKSTSTAVETKKKNTDKSDAPDAKQFVVQIAALADAEKARDIQQELATKGLKAYTEKVKTAGGEVTRVRIGPFSSREAADKERSRLAALGFEGNVAPR